MLYAGDRKDAAETIRGWLEKKRLVLLDRYTYSNIAYQCAKLPLPETRDKLMNWILDLEFRHFGIPAPDLNIFLDVPFGFTLNKLSSSRTGNDRDYLNGTRDIHEESLSFQKKVREMYLRVAETDQRLQVLNCSDDKGAMLSRESIFTLILQMIKEKNLL
jgi:dTMP kinase